MEEFLNTLNESQYEAVTTTDGPIMVMAGAGSGKTKVLTTRIAFIINVLNINPFDILAVTFTNKAANEMKERIGNMLGINTKMMWVSTFHSFCVRILRAEANSISPYKKGFQIIDDDDQNKIMKDIIKELNYDVKPKQILNAISKEKNGMSINKLELDMKIHFSSLKEKYQQYLIDNNLFDFDDLILKTIDLLRENESIRTKYQNKFKYILVDEFQDTNTPQYELMKILSIAHRNLFVVGDDFQSIYSFRGAKIENINRMRRDFSETKLIKLEKNYRSTTEILNLANNVIDKNPNQIKKVLTSNNKIGEKPILVPSSSSYDEVIFVVNRIKELVLKENLEYKDFAVLYRANYLSREFEDEFVKNHIPYKIYGGLSFFARKEIKDIIAYLRLIINHDDNFSFRRIINVPKRKIGESIISRLDEIRIENNLSLFDSISLIDKKGIGVNNLITFKSNIEKMSNQIDQVNISEIISLVVDLFGYKDYLKEEYDKEEYLDRLDNIKELNSVVAEYKELYEDLSNSEVLSNMLQDLTLRTDKEEAQDDNAVRLSTYHQAKGLEFNTVFMVANEDGIFPSQNCFTKEEIEEERRICYVGITRAKKHLFLSYAMSRLRFGMDQSLPLSRFIKEMDNNLYTIYQKDIPNNKKVISKPNLDLNVSFKCGDKINHKSFGDGIIVSVNDDIITVCFKVEIGIKKLKANHPSIRKI